MIRKVILRRFKGFKEVTFDLPGHVVLAGPNNSGKTTLLQAIAVWNLALGAWLQRNELELQDLQDLKGPLFPSGPKLETVPIARQAFVAVPLRSFDLLWHDRGYEKSIEIEVQGTTGWSLRVELLPDTTEQIYIRLSKTTRPDLLALNSIRTAFVPPMSSVALEEPLYANQLTLDALLARIRAGDVLRNLLYQASVQGEAWREICASVARLFGYELLTPDASGPFIRTDYRARNGGPSLDLLSAGSGFQQVLLLLCFLHTRPNSVLLLDEPDAHLHVVLQDAIYGELKRVAAEMGSQLVIATHSEVLVNAAGLDEVRVAFDPGRPLADPKLKQNLNRALRWVTNLDITQARNAPGVLYLEDYTDLEILRAWARVLEHRSFSLLTTELFWRKATVETPSGQEGISARDHYDALTLVRELPGLLLVDGDAKETIESTPIIGRGFQRLRWRRYEIESYLVHPASLSRFVEHATGPESASAHVKNLERYLAENLTPAVLRNPFGDHPILRRLKAREEILPPALTAAGLPGFPYTRYHEIAALMEPEEIHPEVVEKLDLICRAFGK